MSTKQVSLTYSQPCRQTIVESFASYQLHCGCAHSGTNPVDHTCTACKNLDNFANVSVFTGQPPPMTTSGAAVLPVTFSVAEVVSMKSSMSSIAFSTVHCIRVGCKRKTHFSYN